MTPTPENNESKQHFLQRCVAARMYKGESGPDAFAACALTARQHNLADAGMSLRLSGSCVVTLVEPEGTSPTTAAAGPDASPAPAAAEPSGAPARFAILGNTGEIVDFGWYRFIIDLAGVQAKNSIPALRQHDPEKVLGCTDEMRVDGSGVQFFGVFSNVTADAREVLALAREGFPWQASVGVSPLSVEYLREDAVATVNGREVTGPLDIWTTSRVDEISIVPLGADDNTAAIVMSAKLTENAMAADTTPSAAVPEKTPPATPQTLASPTAGTDVPSAQAAPAQASADPAALLAAERERAAAITELCLKLAVPHDRMQRMLTGGVSLDAARKDVLDYLAAQPDGRPVQSLESGQDESEKFRLMAVQGICLAHNLTVENPDPGAQQFRGMGLLDMARLCLERAGMNTRGLSRRETADALFSPRLRLAASVSDFSAVYMDVANKNLLQAYQEAGTTFSPWTAKRTATDFKEIYGVSLSEAPDLDDLGENEEYRHGYLRDNAERFHVVKRGKILRLSWEMIVNDDLGAFMRLPAMFGAATARKYSDVVYALLTGNAVMGDGKPLFDAAHKNIVATGTGITDAGLNAARLVLRSQRGMNGARLNLAPAFMLAPPRLENSALVMLKSAAMPTQGMNSGVYNPWSDSRIQPIVEQRLEPDSPSVAAPWYLVCSPNQVSTVDVAYLDGQETPDIIEYQEFNVDALSYKVRAVMGAGVMDYRGIAKNPGSNA